MSTYFPWPSVNKHKDGDELSADNLNLPVGQLATRTDYLKHYLDNIKNGPNSALILSNVLLEDIEEDPIKKGDIVYRSKLGFKKAQAKMSLYDNFKAAESAFTIGIVISRTETAGNVLIYGEFDIENVAPSFEGDSFRDGRYYLSSISAGKLTDNPQGPLIYVGSFFKDIDTGKITGYVNPQFLDIGTSHVHRAYELVARPAGHLDPTDPSKVIGHIPSNSSYDGETTPTLILGGTWTNIDKQHSYRMELLSGGWGSLYLKVNKDGVFLKSFAVEASDIPIDIDGQLQVKVHIPNSTPDYLNATSYSWDLKLPRDGQGWVNHSVSSIATASQEVDNGANVRALVQGSWSSNHKNVYIYFPKGLKEYKLDNYTNYTKIKISSEEWSFTTDIPNSTPEETVLLNIASVINEQLNDAEVFVKSESDSSSLLVRDDYSLYFITADGNEYSITEETSYTTSVDGFVVKTGEIPLMIVYDDNYEIIKDVITNTTEDTPPKAYTPINLGDLNITIFVSDLNKADNINTYACKTGTRLKASAYDYVPYAKYDYVMGLHPSIDYHFPPVPAQAAGLFVNGIEVGNEDLLPKNATYKIGHKTIHWLTDEENHRPWPEGIQSAKDNVKAYEDKAMAFHFVVGFQCATGPVTSITPAPGAPIKICTYGTDDEAYTGDLMIDAAFDFNIDNKNIEGYLVPKQGKGGALLAGPVVEKIKAGPGISITEAAGCPKGQGTVTISLDNNTLRGTFNEIALENAKQEKLGLFPYISLLGWDGASNIPSAFTMMMRVPSNLDPDSNYRLHLRLVMFGTTGFSESNNQALAGLNLEYNILPDLTGSSKHSSLRTGLLKPASPRLLSIPLGHINNGGSKYTYSAYDPFVVSTINAEKEDDVYIPLSNEDYPIPYKNELGANPIWLKPGYLVAVRISRTSPQPNSNYSKYTGALGFLSTEWSLEEV